MMGWDQSFVTMSLLIDNLWKSSDSHEIVMFLKFCKRNISSTGMPYFVEQNAIASCGVLLYLSKALWFFNHL